MKVRIKTTVSLSQWMTTLLINEGKDKNDCLLKNLNENELQTITNNLSVVSGRVTA